MMRHGRPAFGAISTRSSPLVVNALASVLNVNAHLRSVEPV